MGFDLRKAIVEIRVSQIIDTQSNMADLTEIANDLKTLYGQTNYDFNSKAFIMNNPVGAYNCVLAPDKFIIDSNLPRNIENFCKLTEDTLKKFRQKLFFNNVSRIGVRTFFGKDCESIEHANKVISKCFNFSNTSANKFSDNINDVRVGFSTIDNEYKINYNFTAATNRETQVVNGIVKSDKETYCILADMDVYIDKECKYSDLYNFFSDVKCILDKNIKICESIL